MKESRLLRCASLVDPGPLCGSFGSLKLGRGVPTDRQGISSHHQGFRGFVLAIRPHRGCGGTFQFEPGGGSVDAQRFGPVHGGRHVPSTSRKHGTPRPEFTNRPAKWGVIRSQAPSNKGPEVCPLYGIAFLPTLTRDGGARGRGRFTLDMGDRPHWLKGTLCSSTQRFI